MLSANCYIYWQQDAIFREFNNNKEPKAQHVTRKREANIKLDIKELGWGKHGLVSSCSGQRKVAGSCKCGNESLGFMEFVKLPEQLKCYYLLNKAPLAWKFRLRLALSGFYLQRI